MNCEIKEKITKQIEFYFSDANLRKDKFMINQIKQNSGLVDISTIASFKRVEALSKDIAFITECLKESDKLVVEDGKIKRIEAFDEENKEDSEKIVFVQNVPVTETLESMLEFFGKFGPVSLVRRRSPKSTSVWVEYLTIEGVENILKEKSLSIGDKNLKIVKKTEVKKNDEIEYPKNCLLSFSLETAVPNTLELLRKKYEEFGSIHIDLSYPFTSGVIKFNSGCVPEIIKAIKGDDGDNQSCDVLGPDATKMTLSLITGENEMEFWKTFIAKRKREEENVSQIVKDKLIRLTFASNEYGDKKEFRGIVCEFFGGKENIQHIDCNDDKEWIVRFKSDIEVFASTKFSSISESSKINEVDVSFSLLSEEEEISYWEKHVIPVLKPKDERKGAKKSFRKKQRTGK